PDGGVYNPLKQPNYETCSSGPETAQTPLFTEESTTFQAAQSPTDTATGPLASSPPSSTSLHSPYSTIPMFSSSSTAHPPFTSIHPTSMRTQYTSLPPSNCKNGKWNGRQCECKSGYTGQLCDSILYSFPVEIPNVINATVTMMVKVTHRNFTSDLKNTSSEAYKNFQNLFLSQMDKVYEGDDLPQYKEVIIKELLNGSIVVESDVILEANYTPEYQTLFRNLTKIVKDKIIKETRTYETDMSLCQNSKLCYNGNFTTVGVETPKVQLQPCRRLPRTLADTSTRSLWRGRLTCVNNCTQGTKSQLNCNLGQCQLLRSGPHCVCPNTDTHWYWGKTCTSRTSKRLVYGLVGTGLAVLLVLVVLAVFLSRAQKKQHRAKYDPSQAWRREALPGTFQSTGVWEDRDLKEDKFGLEKGYRHFQPNLQHVDPNTKLNFQRPKAVKSEAP
ncbi:LOW QUALITY PROTEIN: mucin-12-like, partial [Phodopus roborovskii]|uniref:LOW QUALITY PROTEIN: mucin-12-like n=1 Tax=Phodopus roborovskii TaxID=109678 RepID=UPI0021E3D6B7